MNYIELKVRKPLDAIEEEILTARLASIGFESFSEDGTWMMAYIPQKHFQKDALLDVPGLSDESSYSIGLIEDQNWNAVWESNYHPVFIAGRCCIRAPFHDPSEETEFDILLRPKMAFGTAHHETTSLMIEILLDIDVAGKRVLDMGCGTAVLAILAKMKGAQQVTAIDNDEWAYRNAVENAELNGIKDIEIMEGDASSLESRKFDIILANINKNILLADMAAYADALEEEGMILFSGFYETDLEDIQQSANKKGLIFVSHHSKNNWVVASFKKQ